MDLTHSAFVSHDDPWSYVRHLFSDIHFSRFILANRTRDIQVTR